MREWWASGGGAHDVLQGFDDRVESCDVAVVARLAARQRRDVCKVDHAHVDARPAAEGRVRVRVQPGGALEGAGPARVRRPVVVVVYEQYRRPHEEESAGHRSFPDPGTRMQAVRRSGVMIPGA